MLRVRKQRRLFLALTCNERKRREYPASSTFLQKSHEVRGPGKYPDSFWAKRVSEEHVNVSLLSPVGLPVSPWTFSPLCCLIFPHLLCVILLDWIHRCQTGLSVCVCVLVCVILPPGAYVWLPKVQSHCHFMCTLWLALCFWLSDCNCGEQSPSKDISGFPQHPPFSFGAKNRKLRVSWNCTFSMELNSTVPRQPLRDRVA